MECVIEVYDTAGRRVGSFDAPPLLEATRNGPDGADVIRGLAPVGLASLGAGYTVRLLVEGALFCAGTVRWTGPAWGDTKRLVIDRYVSFRELLAFEARGARRAGNTWVSRRYVNTRVSGIVRDLLERAPGPVHGTVAHGAYPEGAAREWAKFVARRTRTEALAVGGIDAGQWVDGARIDARGAWAKDGVTIAGLVVDGAAWPDLRLMMVDAEEPSLNARAVARHPETADWTAGAYAASGYALRGAASREALQALLDGEGIDALELNPHVDGSGRFDGRVDADGRYAGLAFGGGKCLNAALVELGVAEVGLEGEEGLLDPDQGLKDFFSYAGPHEESVGWTEASLGSFEAEGGVLELLTALSAAAGGVFAVGPDLAVCFGPADTVDRVVYYDAAEHGAAYGADTARLANVLTVSGHPDSGPASATATRAVSVAEHGAVAATLACFALREPADLARVAAGLADDLAWPAASGSVTWAHGDGAVRVGQLLELRGGPLRHRARRAAEAWGGRFGEGFVGRVASVTHRFAGRRVETTATLTGPLRSVADPLGFIVRQQAAAEVVGSLRLDDGTAGLDLEQHLD